MIEYLPLVLTGLGLTASIVYYAMVLRNQNKTLQTQLFMNLYQTYSDPEFKQMYTEILFHLEWDDYEDWMRKYGPVTNKKAFSDWNTVAGFFNGLGILVKEKSVDIEMVDELLSSTVVTLWDKMSRNIVEARKHRAEFSVPLPPLHANFEYLYNEIVKYRKKKHSPNR